MTIAAPYYDDVRLTGAGSLRVPTEANPASLATYKQYTIPASTGTVALTPSQAGASLIAVTPTANMIVTLPGCQPGKIILLQNLAAATYTVTVEVAGNTTNTAVVPANTNAFVAQTASNLGVALVNSPGAGQTGTVYETTSGAIPLVSGTYVLNGSGALAETLATPTTPAQDGIVLTIVAGTAHAHTVTTAANKINGNKDTITYAAVGDTATLQSVAGIWVNTSLGGPTPAALSEV